MSEVQYRKNRDIDVDRVRVVSDVGVNGIMATYMALSRAEELGLDLVEIQPDGNPPVCRLMDYSKYIFQQKKRLKENKKKQTKTETKQLKFSPIISEHDLSYRIQQAKGWIAEGNRVKFTVEFHGRQRHHTNLGQDLLNKISGLMQGTKIESWSKEDDREISMVLAKDNS